MAVVNVKSTAVTNADATPRVPLNPILHKGDPFENIGVAAMGASDSAGSTYRIGRISSSDRVTSMQIQTDANTSGTSYKFGVLETAANGGGLANGVTASDTIFASGVSLASAINVWTEKLFPAIAGNSGAVANLDKRVWELLGLSADPFKDYDVAITAVTAGSAGGNVAVKYQGVK